MSIILRINDVPYQERILLSKKDELSFEKKKSNYIYQNTETINAYDIEGDNLYIPFNYALNKISGA